MKSSNLLMYLVLGVLGWVVLQKLLRPPTNSTAAANLTGGALPAGATQSTTGGIANAVQSIFNSIGSFAQTTPKTT